MAGLLVSCASSAAITWELNASRRRPAFSSHLTAPANVFVTGATVTFTAIVTGQSGLATPTGTVTFNSITHQGNNILSTTLLGTSQLDANGAATYSTNSLAAGPYTITASYSGDQIYAAAISPWLVENIVPASGFGVENIGSANSIPITGQMATSLM